MEMNHLLELISETNERGGGLLLNYEGRPAVVVLSIEKYNQLINLSLGKAMPEAASEWAGGILPEDKGGKKKILVTGGAGYIGSHLSRELVKNGFEVVVLDNLSTGKRENVPQQAIFIEGDLSDKNLLRDVFSAYDFHAVFHMAASIEVEESVKEPEKYFENNALNTQKLLSVMNEHGVKRIVFSSTAAVYGEQDTVPIPENAPLRPNNPYGHSKMMAEKVIKYYVRHLGFKAVVFRYFNASGCDFDGLIQATHQSHLIPIVLEVACGLRPYVQINGADYKTFDGTCVRDYVHVLDIAGAHVKSLDKIDEGENFKVINIGTGKGASVKQIINSASEVLNRIIPMEIGPRREGDAQETVADNTKLRTELGYELKYSSMETIITTAWKQVASKVKA